MKIREERGDRKKTKNKKEKEEEKQETERDKKGIKKEKKGFQRTPLFSLKTQGLMSRLNRTQNPSKKRHRVLANRGNTFQASPRIYHKKEETLPREFEASINR